MQVIHTCAQVIDRNHAFCKGNLAANFIAGLVSPLFGLMNDWLGIRVHSAIAMFALSTLGLFMTQFEIYSDLSKFWYLLAAHLFINWQQTTINFGCSRLFGIKCGS